jgi:hypothetical protein
LFDIIGDIHGQANKLYSLLDILGYRQREGHFYHPARKIIFLGDYINKGPQTLQTLQTVRKLVVSGCAYAILGNHEFNLLGYFNQNKNDDYIRPRTDKNTEQHQPTFESFGDNSSLLQEYIQWLQNLPLFLEFEGLRVAHAYWHQESVDYIRKNFPQNCLDAQMLQEMTPDSRVYHAAQELVEGLRLPLPEEAGRGTFKARWWNAGKSEEYEELAIRPEPSLNNPNITTAHLALEQYHYPEDARPLFFGHYNLPGKPIVLAHNYTCLDFNQQDHTTLVAYRWDGEQMLDSRKLVWC